MVRIANPTYDVVFKYLLEDNRIAKLLIGDLLQTEILDLELQPQEYATKPERVSLTVYRIDFKAKIRTREGKTQVVLIEIQKAKFASDIMRFRKYLGEQYSRKENFAKLRNSLQFRKDFAKALLFFEETFQLF